MEGPTPISALIHAATMVTAGVFLLARMSPLFELSVTTLNFILVIGSITALFMGLLGLVQNDIKKIIGDKKYGNMSQQNLGDGWGAKLGGDLSDDLHLHAR